MNLKIKKANELRKTFNAFIEKGEAHLGGSFSMIEILITIYDLFLKNDKFITVRRMHHFHFVFY